MKNSLTAPRKNDNISMDRSNQSTNNVTLSALKEKESVWTFRVERLSRAIYILLIMQFLSLVLDPANNILLAISISYIKILADCVCVFHGFCVLSPSIPWRSVFRQPRVEAHPSSLHLVMAFVQHHSAASSNHRINKKIYDTAQEQHH